MTLDKVKVDRALALIKKGAVNADYFFEQLTSPVWIEPLAKEKLFAKPYNAIRRAEGLSFPFWVPGLYLARMAAISEAQAQVLEILKSLPESDNPRVYEVVADAAAVLPPDLAKHLVSQLLRGVELPFQLGLPEKVGSVVVRLAEAGLAHEARRLARALLAIVPTPAPTEDSDEDVDVRWLHREAKGRMDGWHYGKVLDQIVESLVRSSGQEALRLLCDLLEQAVAAGRMEAGKGPDDFSYIWRESVEHSEARRGNSRDDLVSGVRDAAMQIVDASPEQLREIVEHLRARPTRIFHRVALFLLLRKGERDIALAQDSLSNPPDWEDIGLHPEYELLLARFFGRLTPEVQRVYLDWIDQGPDQPSYVAFRRQMDGREPREAEVRLHRDVWLRDHLGVLAAHLAPGNRQRLAELEQIGPSRQAGRPLYRVTMGWRGERSPLTEAEALSLDWPSLIAKVRDWTPPSPSDFEGPSVEGLAGSVRERVIANPREAVEHLSQVVNIGPQYISAILEALREAIKKKEELAWEPILVFIQQIVDQAHVATDQVDRWRWVSKCAASLVDDSFDAGAASIPIQFRELVWRILERLAQNPDPTPEHEERYGGTNMDPATLSLNTVRGETFHAIARYGLWWRRHLESLPDAADRFKSGFDELPEMRALLDRHLDPTFEPSLAVRAVYGQWFPWLALLDVAWATGHVGAIFPEGAEQAPLCWAAWRTYVVFCNPFTNVLPILHPVYLRAIGALRDGMAPNVGMGERPAEHLAEHLMAYYWRGELALGGDDLVVTFFDAADSKLRGHALEWVGRILAQLDEAPVPQVEERLRALWEWRMSRVPLEAEEMQAFGWWFGSSRMDDGWSLQNLTRLLSASVLPEPDHMVAERLAAIAREQPAEAVQSLDRMIGLASEGWTIHGWIDSARSILETALRSTNNDARERAVRVIHRLGALRFRDFRTLLQEPGVSGRAADVP
jgi:hypothetical protein